MSRYIKWEEVPSLEQLIPTLTYLYTGQLPAACSSSPEVLFGLLQNAHYLQCDRLVMDCHTFLIDKLKTPEGMPFINHEAFDHMWVPALVVKDIIEGKSAPWTVCVALGWLKHPISSDSAASVQEVVDLCRPSARKLTPADVKELDHWITPSAAKSLSLTDILLNKLAATEENLRAKEAELNLVKSQMEQERKAKKCVKCDLNIRYLDRTAICPQQQLSLYHLFDGGDWK